MKIATLIYSVILIVAHIGEKRSVDRLPEAKKPGSIERLIKLEDQWPFEDTLRNKDPYLIELLIELENRN